MRRSFTTFGAVLLACAFVLACGPAAPAQAPAAKPAPSAPAAVQPPPPVAPAAEQPKPPAEAKPAAPAAAAKPAQPPAPSSKEGKRLIHGTSQLNSSYGIYSAALVKLLNSKVPTVNVTLVEYGGVVNNLKRAKSAEVDFALGDQTIVYKAFIADLKGWENDPQKDVRLLWLFDPSALAYVVSERAGIKSPGELNGQPFSPGGQGTNAEVITQDTFGILGINPQYYRGSMTEMADAFKDRRVVGFVKATALTRPDSIILEVGVSLPLRILTWSDNLVQKVRDKLPYYKTTQIPAGVYKGDWNKDPIVAWGTAVSIWATTRFPEDLAYEFTKIVLQDKTEQAAAFPALKDVDIADLTAKLGVVPLHKGALKAYREAGHQMPKELIPPEAQ